MAPVKKAAAPAKEAKKTDTKSFLTKRLGSAMNTKVVKAEAGRSTRSRSVAPSAVVKRAKHGK